MLTKDFYKVLDAELEAIITQNQTSDPFLKKIKDGNQRKSYALLIWFLEFYGKITNYSNYITDGDDDHSCDIIFPLTNYRRETVYHLVQAKWNNSDNALKPVDSQNVKYILNDFQTLLQQGAKITTTNERLSQSLENLQRHLSKNGEVKFIILTLGKHNLKTQDNIDTFNRQYGNLIQLEVIDIERIKQDYIQRRYQQIDPIKPLAGHYNLKECTIDLPIERLDNPNGGYITLGERYEAYIFLVKPKTIFELFEKFGVALFFRNVRNPLWDSDDKQLSEINKQIQETMSNEPNFFWYFNNGITAITYLMPRNIGPHAETIPLTGLQVINGAQTVYAVYTAYREASETQRLIMDDTALITLRLVRTKGESTDLKITRYINSQNPLTDRDFHANDEIQEQLQREFFCLTNIWYERKRKEFRKVPQNVSIVSNAFLVNACFAYSLQDPITVMWNYHQARQTGKNLLFLSHEEHRQGLYDRIFNKLTVVEDQFKEMYCAICLLWLATLDSPPLKVNEEMVNYYRKPVFREEFPTEFFNGKFNILAWFKLPLFKIVATKYFSKKYGNGNGNINVTKQVIKALEEENDKIWLFFNLFVFIDQQLQDPTRLVPLSSSHSSTELYYQRVKDYFDRMKSSFEGMEVDVAMIDNLGEQKIIKKSSRFPGRRR